MKTNTKYQLQKGSATTSLVALVILVAFLIAASVAYYHYHKMPYALTDSKNGEEYSQEASTTTVEVTTSTTTLKTVYVPARTVVRTTPGTPFAGGSIYHNPTYNLTVYLPATYAQYTVSQGADTYTGVPDTVSLHFSGINGNANNFTINVFSMEQWNKIRTIENAAHMNVNSYGEGNYLGENFKFIYSSYGSEPQIQQILDQVRFY